MEIITIRINVDLIQKEKIYQGEKGRYLDLILFPTPNGQYGDYLVKQSGKKDEQLPILGNAKYIKPKSEIKTDINTGDKTPDDDLPF